MSAWLGLLRVALAPTLMWDVAAGLLLAGLPLDGRAVPAVLCGLALYHAGMILNDWADRNRDALSRPVRPLPSGRIAPRAAFSAGLALLAAANLLAAWRLPGAGSLLVGALSGIVLVYDLGGGALRHLLGPPLLALARMGSLHLGVAAAAADFGFLEGTLRPMFAYGIWILFTARLAEGEDEGCAGLRGLQYAIGTAAAPVLVAIPAADPVVHASWLALAAWVLLPAVRDRRSWWPPERVQAAVRRSLTGAPLLLGLALLARGHGAAALAAPGVALAVSLLARFLPPE